MNLLERFGWIRKEAIEHLRLDLASERAINDELRRQILRSEELIEQAYRHSEKIKIDHAKLGDHHEQVKRGAAVLALAVQKLHPATNGRR